jgi:hypothetical protein
MDKCKCVDCQNTETIDDDESSAASSVAIDEEQEEEEVYPEHEHNFEMPDVKGDMNMDEEEQHSYYPSTSFCAAV